MKKRNIKGFTIVELVIVIAIVAILAAILIPTFSSVIDRANESADIQTVRQLNVILAAESIEEGQIDLNKVLDILAEYNFTAENLKPAGDNHKFMWDSEKNVIILVEDNGETKTLIYPIEEGDEEAFNSKITNNKIQEIGSSTGGESGGDNEGEPFDIVAAIESLTGSSGTVKLTGQATISDPISINGNVTIDLNGFTLSLDDDENPADGEEYSYSSVITIADGATLTIENTQTDGALVINEPTYEDYWGIASCSGINVSSGGTLNLNEVNITGNRAYNIANNGTINLTASKFAITYGYGLYSMKGKSNIIKGEFIGSSGAIGAIYTRLYASTGSVSVDGTKFSGEYDDRVIDWASSGELSLLNNVTTTECEAPYDLYDTSSQGNVAISGGTYKNELVFTSAPATISNGTFNGIVSCGGDYDIFKLTITGGTFNGGVSCNSGRLAINGGIFNSTVSATGSTSADTNAITITGGTFEVDSGNGNIIYCTDQNKIQINGGQFKGTLGFGNTDTSYIYISKSAGENLKFYHNNGFVYGETLTKDVITAIITSGAVTEDTEKYSVFD